MWFATLNWKRKANWWKVLYFMCQAVVDNISLYFVSCLIHQGKPNSLNFLLVAERCWSKMIVSVDEMMLALLGDDMESEASTKLSVN